MGDNDILLILNTIGNILSCIACIIVLSFVVYELFKIGKKVSGYKLVIIIIITSDFICSISDSLSWFSDNIFICFLQILGTQFFALLSFMLICILSWYLKNINWDLAKNEMAALAMHDFEDIAKRKRNLKKRLYIHLSICVGILIVMLLMIIIFKMWGIVDNSWCWIIDDFKIFRFFFYYLIIFGVFTYNIFVTIQFAIMVKTIKWSNNWYSVMTSLRIYLLAYIVAFIIMKTPSILFRTFDYFGTQVEWLFILATICNSLIGFMNALIYIINRILKHKNIMIYYDHISVDTQKNGL